ncbi:MAG: hypothetical protein O3A00_12835 [Planctomycetota bacterium]|nr:hypothetical protein [Planctomycetota bacterium]
MGHCCSEKQLLRFLADELPDRGSEQVLSHLHECLECRDRLESLSDGEELASFRRNFHESGIAGAVSLEDSLRDRLLAILNQGSPDTNRDSKSSGLNESRSNSSNRRVGNSKYSVTYFSKLSRPALIASCLLCVLIAMLYFVGVVLRNQVKKANPPGKTQWIQFSSPADEGARIRDVFGRIVPIRLG